MQAVIQSLQSFVLAMAVAAFAHFGMALKDPPAARPATVARHVAFLHPAPSRAARHAPCPLTRGQRRA